MSKNQQSDKNDSIVPDQQTDIKENSVFVRNINLSST